MSKKEANSHLKTHQKKYNDNIKKQIKNLKKELKIERTKFNKKWKKIDDEMDKKRMEIFDRGDNLDRDFIRELHEQCDEKLDEENRLISNENDKIPIFLAEKMEEWQKWVDVYNNRKESNDQRPFYKILAEDFPVPDFHTDDIEHEIMMKHSWYEEWENSVKEHLSKKLKN